MACYARGGGSDGGRGERADLEETEGDGCDKEYNVPSAFAHIRFLTVTATLLLCSNARKKRRAAHLLSVRPADRLSRTAARFPL